jgi:lipopolysaccharide/colanic/teichoic acid biosynthesis glycosyltransferase
MTGFYPKIGKDIFDRIVGIVLIMMTTPIIIVVAIMIRVTLGRKTLYVQDRVGLNGQIFKMYKFRTMQPDRRRSDQFPYSQLKDRRQTHKSLNDPRHTTLGRWLRRRSLDELPQLWNVVRGDMSLVGPRPELPSVVAHYEVWQHQRHTVKPGITGLWQTTIRNCEDSSLLCHHTDLDLMYIQSISFQRDLRMILETVPVMCRVGVGGS